MSICLACEGPPGGGLDEERLPNPSESFDESCYRCHGNSLSPAPPRALGGMTATTEMGVGAHESHLLITAKSTWHAPIPCASCHVVPTELDSAGHIDDDDNLAELTFGELARTGGLMPTENPDGTCSNVYCHGATLTGGTLNEPMWTQVDGTQRECGSCHGTPPPAPHPEGESCGSCHPSMEPGSNTTFLDPALHINGTVELSNGAGGACDSCHGSGGLSAPPQDLAGNTARSAPGVGAHREHLGTSDWRREITCSNCHQVPIDFGDPNHVDGDNIAEVLFDALNPEATVNHGAATCDNLYCHSNGRANNGSLSWTSTSAMTCDSCHQTPSTGQSAGQMSGFHDKHIRDKRVPCVDCHAGVVNGQTDVIAPQLHVNGIRDINMPDGGTWNPATKNCSNMGCHENKNWYND